MMENLLTICLEIPLKLNKGFLCLTFTHSSEVSSVVSQRQSLQVSSTNYKFLLLLKFRIFRNILEVLISYHNNNNLGNILSFFAN